MTLRRLLSKVLAMSVTRDSTRGQMRALLEHIDTENEASERGASEGRLRDLMAKAFADGKIDRETFEIGIEEIEDIYSCPHGVRLIYRERCLQCRGISPRDRELVALIAEGMDTEDIAEEMFLSRYTVKAKIKELRRLLGGDRMTDLPRLVEQFDSR